MLNSKQKRRVYCGNSSTGARTVKFDDARMRLQRYELLYRVDTSEATGSAICDQSQQQFVAIRL